MEKEIKFILNDYETIRNFTIKDYNKVLKDKPRDIAGIKLHNRK